MEIHIAINMEPLVEIPHITGIFLFIVTIFLPE